MPLRVAEINGWLKAVNCCDDCGFVKLFGVDPVEGSGIEATSVWRCGHRKIRQTPHEGMSIQRGFIPIWCPLPEPKYRSNLPSMKEIEDNLKKRGLGG